MTKICEVCGGSFVPKDPRPKRPSRYCSVACRNIGSRSGRVPVVCRQCGKEILRPRNHAAKSNERGPFCGFACYGAWQRENTAGEASPSYKTGAEASHYRYYQHGVRFRVLERDGNKCTRCERTDRLHVHHLEPWRPGQEDPHNPDNLVTLCASCHAKEHYHARKERLGVSSRFSPKAVRLDAS